MLGYEADKYCSFKNQMFLPDYLSNNLAEASLDGKKLLGDTNWLLEKSSSPKNKTLFTPLLLMSLLLIIEIILAFFTQKTRFYKIWTYLIFTVAGLVALFLLFMWLGTDHIATQKNLNLLWAQPFYLIWIFVGIRKKLSKFAITLLYLLIFSNCLTLLLFFFPAGFYNIAVLPLSMMFLINLLKSLFKSKN